VGGRRERPTRLVTIYRRGRRPPAAGWKSTAGTSERLTAVLVAFELRQVPLQRLDHQLIGVTDSWPNTVDTTELGRRHQPGQQGFSEVDAELDPLTYSLRSSPPRDHFGCREGSANVEFAFHLADVLVDRNTDQTGLGVQIGQRLNLPGVAHRSGRSEFELVRQPVGGKDLLFAREKGPR